MHTTNTAQTSPRTCRGPESQNGTGSGAGGGGDLAPLAAQRDDVTPTPPHTPEAPREQKEWLDFTRSLSDALTTPHSRPPLRADVTPRATLSPTPVTEAGGLRWGQASIEGGGAYVELVWRRFVELVGFGLLKGMYLTQGGT